MKYDVTFACGHTHTVDLYGPGAARERKIKWYENSCLCPDCYAAQKAAEMADAFDEVEMSYAEYKREHAECKTKPGTYNKATRTIIVYVPKQAEEEKKEEEPMPADTYDTLRAAINESNSDLIPYISDSAAAESVLEETAKIWDSGESLSTEYPNAFFPEKRKDDSSKEWAAAVQYAVCKLEKLARQQFAAGLTREQAIAICTAIAPYGKVTIAGVSHDMDNIKDAWNAAHPEAQKIQYMGMGER